MSYSANLQADNYDIVACTTNDKSAHRQVRIDNVRNVEWFAAIGHADMSGVWSTKSSCHFCGKSTKASNLRQGVFVKTEWRLGADSAQCTHNKRDGQERCNAQDHDG